MAETLALDPLIAWIGALSLLLNFALSLYSLISSGSRANRSRLDGHGVRLNEHDARLNTVEQALTGLPTKDGLHQVELNMSAIRGDISALREIMGRIENVVSRHEDHLMEGGKR